MLPVSTPLEARLAEARSMRCVVVGGPPEGLADQLALALEGDKPNLLLVHGRAPLLDDQLLAGLRDRYPSAAVAGGSSCRGIMSALGEHPAGVFAIVDPEGAYGVGAAALGDRPREAARAAAEAALEHAQRSFEVPALVWLVQAPGQEEDVLRGIEDVFGASVPVLGGSTADDDVAGGWLEIAGDEILTEAAVVVALFPSVDPGFAFQSGYEPTGARVLVTAREGRRLVALGGEPAAAWYARWAPQVIEDPFLERNVLAATTLAPFGRIRGESSGIPTYLLVHPERVHADGTLSTFATVEAAETLELMTGTLDSLISRAGRVALDALLLAEVEPNEVAGALVIYCGGCRLTIADRLGEVIDGLVAALPGVPFLGAFTFGEVGWLVDQSQHGNLMISVIVFPKDRGR